MWCPSGTSVRESGQRNCPYKGSAKGRGAGIGLSVCNDIVAMHGGTLDIDSVYGEGTSVRITLPLYQDHSAE